MAEPAGAAAVAGGSAGGSGSGGAGGPRDGQRSTYSRLQDQLGTATQAKEGATGRRAWVVGVIARVDLNVGPMI